MGSSKEDTGSRAATRATEDAADAFRPRDPDTIVDRALIPVLVYLAAGLAYWWINHGRVANLDYFVPLADAFLHGRLGLLDTPTWLNEVVPAAGGIAYVVYPPAPALLLLPVVALFGPEVDQATISIVLGAVNVALVSFVLRRMGVGRLARIVLSLVFAFGMITWYSAQAGSSWHFAHVVATFFTFLAIWLCQRDGPAVLIGLAFAAAAMSRLPVAAAAPFFVAYFIDRAQRKGVGDLTPFGWLGEDRPQAWRTRLDIPAIARAAWPSVVSVGVVIGAYLAYNAARFGSPFENGYALIPGLLQEGQYAHGFFSVVNIPRILYAMTLTGPVQVGEFPWIQSRRLGGLSIFLTTPLFLWSLKARRLDWFGLGTWAAILLAMIPILTHADPGGMQFGFRYAQDIYPFLLLLTVRGLGGRISTEAWIAIAIGGAFNLWGMASTYFDWFA